MEISCYFQSVKNVLLLYWSLIMYIYGKLYFTLNKWKYYSKKNLTFLYYLQIIREVPFYSPSVKHISQGEILWVFLYYPLIVRESITFYSQSVKKQHLKRRTYIPLLSTNYIVTTITIVFERLLSLRSYRNALESASFTGNSTNSPGVERSSLASKFQPVPVNVSRVRVFGRCVQRAPGTRWKRVRHARFRFVRR